jgi:hypothetical protein
MIEGVGLGGSEIGHSGLYLNQRYENLQSEWNENVTQMTKPGVIYKVKER